MDGTNNAVPPDRRPASRGLGGSTTGFVLGLLVVLFAVVFLVIGQTVLAQRNARSLAGQRGDAIMALDNALTALLDAETGQRGFLLTEDPAYLAPYSDARQRIVAIEPRFADIVATSPDPATAAHLARVRELVHRKLDELDRTVALTRDGQREAALAIVHSNVGKAEMDGIRAEIDWLTAQAMRQRREAFDRAETFESRLLPMIGVLGAFMIVLVVVALRSERARAAATVEAEQAAALREANERSQLLARELNHRVKNLFSVVLSIIAVSGRKPVPGPELVQDIRARVHALALAHAASQGSAGHTGIDDEAVLGDVVRATLQPYAEDEAPGRVAIDGPEVTLPVRMVTPIGLLVHELATNAVKYGALSLPSGTVTVAWRLDGSDPAAPRLVFDWREAGGPPLPGNGVAPKAGFGSRLVTLAAQQLGGTIERAFPPGGAEVTLICPLN